MSAAMELHVALSMRHDAVEAYRLAHAYRDEVLAEDQATPLVVSRFDVAMEPAPEEEPVLTVGAIAEDGRPVALLFDEETRRKVAGWLAPAVGGEEATAAAAKVTPAYNCVCREDPNAGPAHSGHARWCPANKPTPERITELRQGIGEELTRDELDWLRGTAGRDELHIIGARGGHWTFEDLPGAVLILSQYLAATVAVIERLLLDQDEEKASAPAPTATPRDTVFDPLPSYLHAIGHAGSETERGLYAAYVQAIAEVVRLQAETASGQSADGEAAPGPTGRVAQLLDAIRTKRGRWTTTRAAQFYREAHIEPPGAQWSRTRTVARGDLRDLATWGHLLRHEEPGRQFYTLNSRKAVSP